MVNDISKDFLKGIVMFTIIVIVIFIFFIIPLNYFMGYLGYKYLENEGYQTRFSFSEECEINTKQVDGSSKWMPCSNLGDTFTLENYGVRK